MTRFASSFGIATAITAATLVIGCQLVSGMADVTFGGGGAGGAGGEGGASPPCDPAQCPDAPGDCQTAICDAGQCSFRVADAGQICDVGVGKVCNGVGVCQECLSDPDCTSPTTCEDGFCTDATCQNGQLDQLETDVDCGGPDCAPCPENGVCLEDGDCLTLWCDGNECAACGGKSDCGLELYCDETLETASCVPQKRVGAPCADDVECLSGQCEQTCAP